MYNPGIPEGLPSPRDQVVSIQTNFAQFAAIFSATSSGVVYNHTALNMPKQGNHESIIFLNQPFGSSVVENSCVLYAKNVTSNVDTQPQLFYKTPAFLPNMLNPDTPGNPSVQLTYNTVNTSGPVYQSFLPGGYLLYFGSVSATGTVTLSPKPTKILVAIAYPNNLTSGGTPVPFSVSTQILSNNYQFNIISNATGSYTFTWMAIAQN